MLAIAYAASEASNLVVSGKLEHNNNANKEKVFLFSKQSRLIVVLQIFYTAGVVTQDRRIGFW
jgi:hypothetical protein